MKRQAFCSKDIPTTFSAIICMTHTLTFQMEPTCQKILTDAVNAYGLTEKNIHDVFNIFTCSGFTKDTHEYFVKVSLYRAALS